MSQSLHQLVRQADELHKALANTAGSMEQLQYNLTGIQRCADQISSCLRKVGNNRTAALSARDTRKVMEELELAANELQELLSK
ncbi:hypothetical protein [Marinobacterium lutimaris]|uniref:Uncharacterized protein n=1 Tax=Marinobacterium lutimaris TaxID=568106 RepID=A0A1H5UUM7_9GAMM|nr:hypothetical protein [Marinobacterium lutimaris]SEF78654.1 hypothetical protein SAMN05444390_101512 [Marinobacterium lutimaris]